MKEEQFMQTVQTLAEQVVRSERLSLDEAVSIIKAGEAYSQTIKVPMVLAVVDDGGNLIAQHRMDNAILASIQISYAKAYTAVSLRMTTEEVAKCTQPGQPLYGIEQILPGKLCIFGGGIPIFRNGRCIGALGVSGGSVKEDIATATAALKNFQ